VARFDAAAVAIESSFTCSLSLPLLLLSTKNRLTHSPALHYTLHIADFSIYHNNINVVDPSGVQLIGLDKYKSAFAFLQTFLNFWFSNQSGIQFRMVYDVCRSSIRISWHAVLIPKVPLGRPMHIDGISYYQLDRLSGKVIEHKIETLMINNAPVTPPYGLWSILQQDAMRVLRSPQGVPVGVGAGAWM
jgi:Uncharacterized conserved protein (DUF2358)